MAKLTTLIKTIESRVFFLAFSSHLPGRLCIENYPSLYFPAENPEKEGKNETIDFFFAFYSWLP